MKSLWTIFVITSLLGSLTLNGCQYSQLPPYCNKETYASDLVGTWVPTESKEEMVSRGGYKVTTHQLILRKDGTFSMWNMPDCVFSGSLGGWDSSKNRFKSGKGRWKVTPFVQHNYCTDEGTVVWDIDFKFQTPGIGQLPSGSGSTLQWRENSYFLNFQFGDADMGQKVTFHRGK